MKWSEIRRVITGKMGGTIEEKEGHDRGWVPCGEAWIGWAKIGKHAGELKPWEFNNVAASFHLSPNQFKKLIACEISKEKYCEIIAGRAP